MARKETKSEKPVKVQKTIVAGTSTPTVWNHTPRTRVVVKQAPVEVPNSGGWMVHPRKLTRAIRRVKSGIHGSPWVVDDNIKRSCTRFGLAFPTRRNYDRTMEVLREREELAAKAALAEVVEKGREKATRILSTLRKETALEMLRRLVATARIVG